MDDDDKMMERSVMLARPRDAHPTTMVSNSTFDLPVYFTTTLSYNTKLLLLAYTEVTVGILLQG